MKLIFIDEDAGIEVDEWAFGTGQRVAMIERPVADVPPEENSQ